jgi:hypothetical protein
VFKFPIDLVQGGVEDRRLSSLVSLGADADGLQSPQAISLLPMNLPLGSSPFVSQDSREAFCFREEALRGQLVRTQTN